MSLEGDAATSSFAYRALERVGADASADGEDIQRSDMQEKEVRVCCGRYIWDWEEFKEFYTLMIPTLMTFVCRMGMNLTDLGFIGHLHSDPHFPGSTSKNFLAAGSVALTWMQLTNNFLYSGMVGALQTLCSQAFTANPTSNEHVARYSACVHILCMHTRRNTLVVGRSHHVRSARRYVRRNVPRFDFNICALLNRKASFSVAYAQISCYCRSKKNYCAATRDFADLSWS